MAKIPKLEDHSISKDTGFLFLEYPKGALPDCLQEWSKIAKNSEQLIVGGKLREAVAEMPLLDHTGLKTEAEKLLAYTALCFIGNGYVHQGGDENKVSNIPKQLAIPLAGIAEDLGLQPCHSYVSTVIANVFLRDSSKRADVGNLKAVFWTPGGKESEWFFVVSAATEVEGALALRAVSGGMEGVLKNDPQEVLAALRDINQSINNVENRAFVRMHDNLSPHTFYNVIRLYFNGLEKVEFEGVNDGQQFTVIGASAAQSPLIQSLDAALGIKHKTGHQNYLDSVRRLMLPAHQKFIQALWDGPNMREYIENSGNAELKNAYNSCIDSMTSLRSYHLKAVRKWIVEPAGEGMTRGTGGQANIEMFLSGIKETAAAHKLE